VYLSREQYTSEFARGRFGQVKKMESPAVGSPGGNMTCPPDLFPCGSGRKYKNCCVEDQGSGLPHEARQVSVPAGLFFISLLDMLPTFFLLRALAMLLSKYDNSDNSAQWYFHLGISGNERMAGKTD